MPINQNDFNAPRPKKLQRLPPVPVIDNLISDRFNKSNLVHYRRSKERRLELERIVLADAVKAAKMAADAVRAKPQKQVEPQMPKSVMSDARADRINFELLRTYSEQAPTTKIQPEWFTTIRGLLPRNLRGQKPWQEMMISDIEMEISDNFTKSMVKSTLDNSFIEPQDFIKPKKKDLEKLMDKTNNVIIPTEKPEIGKLMGKDSFKSTLKTLENNLLITHKSHRSTLNLCNDQFTNDPAFTNPDFFQKVKNNSMDLNNIKNTATLFSEQTYDRLMATWFPTLVKFFSDENSLERMSAKKQENLYRSVNTLLSNQIKYFLHDLVEEWTHLFDDGPDNTLILSKHPKIRIQLAYEDNHLEFYPSMEDISQTCQEVSGVLSSSLKNLPMIQSWLTGSTDAMNVCLDDHLLEKFNKHLEQQLLKLFEEVQVHLEEYNQNYLHLINGVTKKEIDKFLHSKPNFDQVTEKIDHFNNIINEINARPSFIYLQLCRLDCDDAKHGLRQMTKKIVDKLVNYAKHVHLVECRDVVDSYKNIFKTAQKEPTTSDEMIQLQAWVENARTKTVKILQERVQKTFTRLNFLFSTTNNIFVHDDLLLHKTLLNWPVKIEPVFEKNDEILDRARKQGEQRVIQKKEKLMNDIVKLRLRIEELGHCEKVDLVNQYLTDTKNEYKKIDELRLRVDDINREESNFKWENSSYPELDEINSSLDPYQRLYGNASKWLKMEKRWNDGELSKLDAETVEGELDEAWREMYSTNKMLSVRFKKKLEELQAAAKSQKERKAIPKTDPMLDLCGQMCNKIKLFRENIPFISTLCNPGLRQRHWDKMSEIAGRDLTPDAGTTLRKMLKLNLGEYMDQFELISGGATKEHSLEKALLKMQEEWEAVNFGTIEYRDSGIHILSSVDDIQTILDDHIVKTQTMRGSPFIKPFENEIKIWEDCLMTVQETIDEWLKVQSQWLYLEPIFSSEDIMAQMPEEGRLFKQVDKLWREVMKNTVANPLVIEFGRDKGILNRMTDANNSLDRIMKGLNEYLEVKRLYFARFFFLSNDEMLEILSETKDPYRVQPHLKKCFEGIAKLEFREPELDILAMKSAEGEKVQLTTEISTAAARGAVEKWLLQVEEGMLESVRDVIIAAKEAYTTTERHKWVQEWPGQVVIFVSQLFWTQQVHEYLGKAGNQGLKDLVKVLEHQLSYIVEAVRGKLKKQTRITLGALVTIDVHAKDVVEQMVKQKVNDDNDFNWLSQLRYYWSTELDNARARIINADVKYAYEYLGNSPRLVITPLTDRCYRTLVSAFYLHLGGAPEGPAGTGKTETTKDLAKALAVQCVVFNCSDQLDYRAMGKFFKGLASSGAWACFDEFNRIELEVLSVIAQQMLCIQRAIEIDAEEFDFEGTTLRLNNNCFVAITMNPGYAGRSELPDNLKVMFRTVAMMVPDYALIAEISLYSCGFLDARNLSVKIVFTYRLCSEQLSSQFHYDYGMRAVKAVLVAAGNLKLAFPNEKEDILLLRSIQDVNLPKFLSHDIPLFKGIISDLFPGIQLEEPDYDNLLKVFAEMCKQHSVQPAPGFQEKVIQTYEMMIVRHGFMLVGDPFAGKTKCLHVLADTLSEMKKRGMSSGDEDEVIVNTYFRTVNPKAITMGQLFGCFDPVSHEWTDGIVANTFREFAAKEDLDRKWVVFDGPIDTLWIESMNTVLDDNKKLCLMSGEIIAISNSMSLIFETQDLSQASPATVSRCGMIYMEPRNIGWKPLVQSWLDDTFPVEENFEDSHKKQINECRDLLSALFDWLVDPCIYFAQRNVRSLVKSMNSALVQNLMRSIVMLCHQNILGDLYSHTEGESPELANTKNYSVWLQAALVFGLTWSVGANIDSNGRESYSEFIMQLLMGKNEDHPIPIKKFEALPPVTDSTSIYDFYYDFTNGKGKWFNWTDMLKGQSIDINADLFTTTIPTADTARYSFLVDISIKSNFPFMLVGPTGTGKSVYIKNKLMNDTPKDKFMPAFVTFSAKTSANQTQDMIMSKLDKRRKGVFGPQFGKKMCLFVDDVSMPQKEVYGAQPPIELLRQMLDHGNWYDLKETTRIELIDLILLTAMAPPGAGKNEVTSRFQRHFNVVSILPFSDETLTRIFSTLVATFMRKNEMAPDITAVGGQIVSATLEIYKEASKNLLPTPSKSHYTFNLRDFSRVILGCLIIKKSKVPDKKTFQKLWVHETLRVFSDRLVSYEDQEWCFGAIKNAAKNAFKDTVDNICGSLASSGKVVTLDDIRSLMFGDYMNPDLDGDDRLYEEILNLDEFQDVVQNYIFEYNQTHKAGMNLVIFRYVLEHLSKIARVLKTPGGNALLVGVGGSGRQSLTRLSAYMCGTEVFQPEISKSYA